MYKLQTYFVQIKRFKFDLIFTKKVKKLLIEIYDIFHILRDKETR